MFSLGNNNLCKRKIEVLVKTLLWAIFFTDNLSNIRILVGTPGVQRSTNPVDPDLWRLNNLASTMRPITIYPVLDLP